MPVVNQNTDRGMECPSCGKTASTVKDSRRREVTVGSDRFKSWKRRRECVHWDTRFNTYEIPAHLIEEMEQTMAALRTIGLIAKEN